MLLCCWMLQLIHRRYTQCSICKCLNCSSISLCPKAFQPRVERMLLICLCDTDTSHRKQDVCHWTFLSLWQPCLPVLPCLLLTVLLFPFKVWRTWWWATKVWALFLFHSAFSVFLFSSCFQTIAAKDGQMLASYLAAASTEGSEMATPAAKTPKVISPHLWVFWSGSSEQGPRPTTSRPFFWD